VTHRLPLAKINTALDLVRQGEAGRVLIEMPT
jgi:Zn-dependent alcohol dehydrogenase